MEVLNDMNVLMVVPWNTVGIRMNASCCMHDGAIQQAAARFDLSDILRGRKDFDENQEGYFKDHPEMAKDDAKAAPMIMTLPDNAVQAEMELTMFNATEDIVHETRLLKLKEIMDARTEFLKYIVGGDDYNAVYVLTDEGRALADSLLSKEMTE